MNQLEHKVSNFWLYKWTYEIIGLLQSSEALKEYVSEIGALISSAVWTLISVKEDWKKWIYNK